MYLGRIILAFLGFIVFIVIMFKLFTGHAPAPVNTAVLKPLPAYAGSDATVSFTTDGIVNGDELHRSIRITVSNTQRSVDVLQGYNPQVIQSKSFENNQEAYDVFLRAIGNSGFLLKSKNTKAVTDERGLCPLGFRYILDLNQDGSDLSRLWGSSCGPSIGNAAGAIPTIRQLFEDQIPDYQTIVGPFNLSAVSDTTQ
jgi:hypothetical protein